MTKNYWPHSAVITATLGCALLLTAIEGCECCCRKPTGNGERGGTGGITGTTGGTGAAGTTGTCQLYRDFSIRDTNDIWRCNQGTCSGPNGAKCVLQVKSQLPFITDWSDVQGDSIPVDEVLKYRLAVRCTCIARH